MFYQSYLQKTNKLSENYYYWFSSNLKQTKSLGNIRNKPEKQTFTFNVKVQSK